MSIKYIKGFINKLTIMGLALFIFSGCGKDFLNELPTGAVSEMTFWKTEEDAHGGLMGVYSTFYHSYAERVQDLDKSMAWMCAFAGYGSWRNFGWSRGDQLNITSGPPIALWPACYKHISQANNFLQNIEKVNMDNEKKVEMSAEVRFLRSFTYFWLSQTFGNVPLVKEVLTFDEANQVSQVTEQEVLQFALDEVRAIENDLPVKQPAIDAGRIERGAALVLEGRILMTLKKWPEAAEAFKKVIDLNRYSINQDFKSMFLQSGENNNEFIFVNKYVGDLMGEAMSQNNMRSSLWGGFNALNVFQHFVDAFLMTDGNSIEDSPLYDPNQPFNNRDPRLYASVLLSGYSTVFGKIFNGSPEEIVKVGQTGPNISGYIINKFFDPDYKGNRQAYGSDYPQMRYAEVLLSYLECQLEAGVSITQDLLDQTINKIRLRPSVNIAIVTELNPDKLKEIIKRERWVEFAFEGGIRYWDLRRWHLLKEEVDREVYGMKITNDPSNYTGQYNINADGHLIIGRVNFQDYNYLWPIPITEIDVNSNLKQNPGYN